MTYYLNIDFNNSNEQKPTCHISTNCENLNVDIKYINKTKDEVKKFELEETNRIEKLEPEEINRIEKHEPPRLSGRQIEQQIYDNYMIGKTRQAMLARRANK